MHALARLTVHPAAAATRRMRRGWVAAIAVGALLASQQLTAAPAHAAIIPTPPAQCPPQRIGLPVLTGFALAPTAVDATTGAAHVGFTVQAHDNVSQITAVGVLVVSPKRDRHQRKLTVDLALTAGTRADGTWTGSLTIPGWTIPGVWRVFHVVLSEPQGIAHSFSPRYKPWITNGWPQKFRVSSVPDLRRSTMSTFAVSPTAISTRNHTRSVTVQVGARDNLSGTAAVEVTAQRDRGRHYMATTKLLSLTAGTRKRGTWTGRLVFPQWAGVGTRHWDLRVRMIDRAGNVTPLSTETLLARHLTASVAVTSRTDATKPRVSALTVAPTTIDATAADRKVSVSVRLRDRQSGVHAARLTFASPSGALAGAVLHRTSGSTIDGTWRGVATVHTCSEPGRWQLLRVEVWDGAGNLTKLTAADAAARGYQSSLDVQAIDATGPKIIVPKRLPHTSPLVITFTEPTLWADGSAQSNFHVSEGEATDSYTEIHGTWTCANIGGPVTCDADGANVTSATFTPAVPFSKGGSYYLDVSGWGIYDLFGNGPISGVGRVPYFTAT